MVNLRGWGKEEALIKTMTYNLRHKYLTQIVNRAVFYTYQIFFNICVVIHIAPESNQEQRLTTFSYGPGMEANKGYTADNNENGKWQIFFETNQTHI